MKQKFKRGGILVLSLILLLSISFCGIKFIKHEQNQEKLISELISKTDYLEEKLRQAVEYYEYDTNYTEESFNYFAIGNSLTMINSWGRGICSTQPDNDYFNLVSKYLENKYGDVISYAYNFSTWERASDRYAILDLLDVYLDEGLDLVTIQLGENVTDLGTYEEDLENLAIYIRNRCPEARIIIIGDWWDYDKNDMRKTAAYNCDCGFADLSKVIGNEEYQSKPGTICFMKDGTTEKVSEAASTHPGDKGMEYIADKVIECMK